MGWFWNIFTGLKKKGMSYQYLYDTAVINGQKIPELKAAVDKIKAGQYRYEVIASVIGNGIPWWFIGITHFMEAACNFALHLHCGDPLTARTIHVPKGRPKFDPAAGIGKPYTWEESALDVLHFTGYDEIQDWSIGNCLNLFERYNGLGYKKRGVPSPYLWSFTNHYVAGKYVADGKYDPKAVSKQPGVAAIMKTMGV